MKKLRSIEINIHAQSSLSSYYRQAIKTSAQLTIDSIPKNTFLKMTQGISKGLISVAVVGPKAIHKLNLKYRFKDKPTDVLSFSRMELGLLILPNSPTDLGDVILCWKIVNKQAREYGTSVREEISRLTVHGVLHLFGYDHETNQREANKMFSLQNKIMRTLFRK